jgi:hypothetical protein
VGLARRPRPAQSDPQALDVAAAVVEELHAQPDGVPRDARQHHLASEQAQRAPLVAELGANLERERVGIPGLALRVGPGAELDHERRLRRGAGRGPEQQVAAG